MLRPIRLPPPAVRAALADARSGRVAFVAHCLLNQNARYLGGASGPGVRTDAIASLAAAGYGIVQMPCPEFAAWGGPLKPLMWLGTGWGSGAGFRALRLALPAFSLWTRLVYRGIARRTARLVRLYRRAGISVVGFVGIDGSPSCGLVRKLDLGRSFAYLAGLDSARLDREEFNRGLYAAALTAGKGVFLEELQAALERALGKAGSAEILWSAFDLPAELEGRPASAPLFE